MENLVIKGIISTTSNKQSKDFKSENPQKTAYLQLDEKNAKLLEEFGVQKYTSKNSDDFYCIMYLVIPTIQPPVPMREPTVCRALRPFHKNHNLRRLCHSDFQF